MVIVTADGPGLARAVRALAAGGLVLHPTETILSLSGDAGNQQAVEAAYRLKGYHEGRPFLCLVADLAAARELARSWPAAADRLSAAFWPGPLTLIVAAGPAAPGPVTSAGRIALRPASDPVSRALLAAWGRPLFSTSANRKGDPPAASVEEALTRFGGLAVVPDASRPTVASGPGVPSTIVDVTVDPARVIRRGALAPDRLREVVPDLM